MSHLDTLPRVSIRRYGDLSARTDLGHTLSATEALIGQIYLVTVVAVIVSNLRPRKRERA
jgi:hypothetical protein